MSFKRHISTLLIACTILFVCAFANTTTAQNLLTDPSFEVGNLNTHWSPGGVTAASQDQPNCGTYNAWFGTAGGSIWQEISGSDVEVGCTYVLDFESYRHSVGTGWASLSMTFYDASYNSLGSDDILITTAGWSNYSLQLTAPAGSEYIGIWAGTGNGGNFRIDCLDLTKNCGGGCGVDPGSISNPNTSCPSNNPSTSANVQSAFVDCNFIDNDEFDNGTTGWSLWNHSTADANFSIDNSSQLSGPNSAYIDIISQTGTAWHIEFSNYPHEVTTTGSYQISFDAKAAGPRPLYVSLQLRESPWTTYWSSSVNLTTSPQTFTFTGVVPGVNSSNIGLMFKMGDDIDDVWIDDVLFGEEGCSGGTIEYQWESRYDDGFGGWTSWTAIAGATGSAYNPPVIPHATQYKRKAKTTTCNIWEDSNIVTADLCLEEDCSNDQDDDGDGAIDCNDSDCTGSLYCSYDCTEGVTIDTYGGGCDGGAISLDFPNNNNILETTVEVVYKGCYPGSYIYVQSSAGTLVMEEVNISGGSSDVYIYRETVNGPATNLSVTQDCGTCSSGLGMQSMVAYVVRSVPTAVGYEVEFTNTSGYCNIVNIPISIPTASSVRDIDLKIPVSEITSDGRYLTVTATSNTGGVSDSETIFGPDLSLGACCFDIIDLTLENVPGNSTSINIAVISDGANNPNGSSCGQSWVLSGSILLELDCECPSLNVSAGANQTICEGEPVTLTATGASNYLWNTGATTASITVSPFSTTTFTVYGFDDPWCMFPDEVTVTVEPIDCVIPPDITINCGQSSAPSTTGQATACDYYNLSYSDRDLAGCPRVIERTWSTDNGLELITTRTATNQGASACGNDSKAFWLSNNLGTGTNTARLYDISNGVFEEYDNGTARFTGTLTNKYDASLGFTLDCTFYNRVPTAQAWQFKTNETFCNNYPFSTADWYFYTDMSGQLIGTGGLAGAKIELGIYKFFFGVGTGANLFEDEYGAAAWLTLEVTSEPSNGLYTLDGCNTASDLNCADFNIRLSGSFDDIVPSAANPSTPATCDGIQLITIQCDPVLSLGAAPTTICVGESSVLTASTTGGIAPLTYNWNNGLSSNSTHTVNPTSTTTYEVTVTDDAGCTDTESITVTVISNITDEGSIGHDESYCGSYDPEEIISVGNASGGTGGTITYLWQKRTKPCATGVWSAWEDIAGATGSSYDPPTITDATEYRRGVRRSDCFDWTYTNSVLKEVRENYSDPGVISDDESMCGAYDPALIESTVDPSGGCGGSPLYRWQSREQNCGDANYGPWTTIAGAADLEYDPGTISMTTQFRRISRRFADCTPVWTFSNIVTKTVINNYTDGGTVEGDESACGSFDPSEITNVVSPSGACVGTDILRWYKWEQDCATGTWSSATLIAGANELTYDPPTINVTTRYRRYMKLSGCNGTGTWNVSNYVYKTVVENLDQFGQLTGNENSCGPFDPSDITFSTVPSGGCGADIEYRWYERTQDCVTGVWGDWYLHPNSNQDHWDPGVINVTTQYAYHVRRGDCPWTYGHAVVKTVSDNYTSGGTIDGEESFCGSYDPVVMTSVADPSGGCGANWGIWQSREQDCSTGNWTAWSNVAGSTNLLEYDPPVLNATTEYRRLWVRTDCSPSYLYSNVIKKEVIIQATDGGDISGDESFCGGYDPAEITSIAPATGGCGGELVYFWGSRTVDCVTGVKSGWTNFWAGETYDPPPITQTTEYWRRARRTTGCSPGWLYSNIIVKEVVEQLDDGGSISGEESQCGGFDPSIITSTAFPTGGCGGEIAYLWGSRTVDCDGNTSAWTNFWTDEFYDPPAITQTTEYIRRARRIAGCSTAWVYSNIIRKTVSDNVVDLGTLTGTETMCGPYDPTAITFTTLPSGGCGEDIEYRWYERTQDCVTGSWSNWNLQANSNQDYWDPGMITQTTHYAFHVRRGNCDWIPGPSIIKYVNENFTSGGTIAGDESMCGGYDPGLISNIESPSGGCGFDWSIWQSRELDCATGIYTGWANIDGTGTLLEYDPPAITTTTEYRRVFGRTDCSPTSLISNVVVKEVVQNFDDGGSITGDESSCGGFDPTEITNTALPTGGCGGEAVYLWGARTVNCDGTKSAWTNFYAGPSYDPPAITQTTEYWRRARRTTGCSTIWVYSNIVVKTVVENIDQIGDIEGNETFCGSYDPTDITFVTLPSGGCGADIEYRWYERTQDCVTGDWGDWVLLANSDQDHWDPGVITETTQYAYHSRRGDCAWVPGDSVIKFVNQNYTDGGTIDGDESFCGSFDPQLITNISDPSGGCGTNWGLWQSRELDCSTGNYSAWANVDGTTNMLEYDPPTITSTTQYRRLWVRSDCNPNYLYSNVITKEVVENFTAGGTIAGDEEMCGGYDPAEITSIVDPSGGCGGEMVYYWGVRTIDCDGNASAWSNFWGDLTYDPPPITQTTEYFRRARRATGCSTNWRVSNIVRKTVVDNITNVGTIGSSETFCGSYDPADITFTSYPSGGCGADIEYRWYERTQDCATEQWNDWVLQANSNQDHWDPGVINVTTQYAYHVRKGSCDWVYGGSVIKYVTENYTDGGTVVGDESYCGDFDPTLITSTTSPSGGCGSNWGLWQSRELDCATGNYSAWANIDGTVNLLEYDPPAISTTTQYRRLWVRSECNPNYLYSNVITKEVVEQLDNGGSIDGEEEMCGGYDPSEITSTAIPTGGCGGEIVYFWGSRTIDCETGATSEWTNFWAGESYDPPAISQTTEYWRRARRTTGCSTAWVYSNIVRKTVVENISDPGQIEGDETQCGGFDPTEITSLSLPSGGCGTEEIRWYKWEKDCVTGDYSSGILIPGENGYTLDPGPITVTTRYRRYSRRNPCSGSPNWNRSNYVYKTVVQNYTDGGTIAASQEGCESRDPDPFTATDPSGGCEGTSAFQWQSKIAGGDWTDIPGATSATYDSPEVTEYTEFRRLSRRGSCDYVTSNVIEVVIYSTRISNVIKTTDQDCDGNCSGSFTVEVDHAATGDFYIYYTYMGTEYQHGPFTNSNTVTIDNLCAGAYTSIRVLAIDSGCSETWNTNITIYERGAEWEHVTHTDDASHCNESCDGSFTVDANHGLTGEFNVSYTYDGVVTTLGPYDFAGDILIDDLCAGIYSDITITSIESGCTAVWPDNIEILEPYPDANILQVDDDECQEEEGEVILNVTGGTWPYTVNWTTPDGSDSGTETLNVPGNITLEGLIGGNTYCISVTDSNGCTID